MTSPSPATPSQSATVSVLALDGQGGFHAVTGDPAAMESAADTARWVHVNFSSSPGAEYLRRHSGIAPTVVDAMLEEDSRPRFLSHGGGALLILRGANMNPGSDFEDMISLRIWLEPGRVVTASRRHLHSVADVLDALGRADGPRSPAEVVLVLIERLGFYIGEVVDQMGERLEAAETEVTDPASVVRSSPFSAMRRKTARIRRSLAPQREALERLSQNAAELFSAAQVHELREEVNWFTLLLEELDLIRERALVAQEELLGILAHGQNQRMLLLAIVSAVFLPLAFLTGLMGMNVAGLPGTENPWSFWLLVIGMSGVAVGILVLFRLKKWL
jgi:zinc transporter